MRGFAFPPTTNTGDWRAPFYVAANDELVTWHPPDDEVILGLSGGHACLGGLRLAPHELSAWARGDGRALFPSLVE